jgi:opacity protein-like surface antigen
MAAKAERYQTTWFVLANGDLAIPSSPGSFKNHWKGGFGGGLGVGLQVTPWVTLVWQNDATFHSLDAAKYAEDLNVEEASGGTFSVVHSYIAGRAHVSYPDPEVKFLFYLLGGVGIIRTKTKTITTIDQGVESKLVTTTDISFAANAGFGLDYQMSDRVRLFVEGQAVLGFTKDDDTVYFPMKLGLCYKIGPGPYM